MKPFIVSFNCICTFFLLLQVASNANRFILDKRTFSYVSNPALRVLSTQTFFWAMGLLVFTPVAFKTCIYATGKIKTNVHSEKYLGFQSVSLLFA